MTTAFLIKKNVPIPPRTIPNAGPRETKYPLDEMEQGDSFDIEVKDEKQARQKQSQFSSLAKTRGIKLVTRFIAAENVLRIWHDGKAPEKAEATDAVATDNAAPVTAEVEEVEEEEIEIE